MEIEYNIHNIGKKMDWVGEEMVGPVWNRSVFSDIVRAGVDGWGAGT